MGKNSNVKFEIKEDDIANMNTVSMEMRFTDKELSIMDSLKLISPELAVFYKDGLYIKKYPFESKSYILAHLLREIDGGLRNVFENQTYTIEVKCENAVKQKEK